MTHIPGGPPQIKCVVVGDGAVGKTCMLSTYANGVFPLEYVPTVFDNFETTFEQDGHSIQLTLWDTAGQEDYDKLRPLSYSQTDVFIICFSVGHRTSFDNVHEKWAPELAQYCPGTRVLLVGTKSDLRNDRDFMAHLALHQQSAVSTEEGLKMAKSINAARYLECSAMHRKNLHQVFEDAIRLVLNPDSFGKPKKPSSRHKVKCTLL